MPRKTEKIRRENVSAIRPKKLKPFNLKSFLEVSEKLKKAIEKEEEMHGRFTTNGFGIGYLSEKI